MTTNNPGAPVEAKTITSRDGQWTYTVCGGNWVVTATHVPTGRSMPARASLTTVRKRAASGELLRVLNEQAGKS